MLASIAAILSLGIIAPLSSAPLPPPLPGIHSVTVRPPASRIPPIDVQGLTASGMLLVDMESGEDIVGIAPDTPRPIGSLTKLMTALLIVERHDKSEIVTVPTLAEYIGGSTLSLHAGQKMTVFAALQGLLIPSANDVAYSLAVFDAGSVGSFVARMNDRAKVLGLRATHFANPAGFDNDAQASSPRDLAWIAAAALRHAIVREIVGTRTARIAAFDGTEWHLRNTNELLHYNANVYGVKTGTTDRAGECLIVLFTEGYRQYLLILLGSRDRYADALSVMEALRIASHAL